MCAFFCGFFFFSSFLLSLSTKNFLNFGELSGFNFLKGTGGHRAGGDSCGLPRGLQEPQGCSPTVLRQQCRNPPLKAAPQHLGFRMWAPFQGSSPKSPRKASLHPPKRYPHILQKSIPSCPGMFSPYLSEQHPHIPQNCIPASFRAASPQPPRQQPLIPWESSPVSTFCPSPCPCGSVDWPHPNEIGRGI